MNKPAKQDLRKLKSLLNNIEKIELAYDKLTDQTKTFLQDEFYGQTKIHLYNFDRNIADAIRVLTFKS